ncbi:hypothetical protein ACFS3C_17660 [Azotobacter vinelandii]
MSSRWCWERSASRWGALIAGVLPTTRQEDELLGQASDTLTDKLRVKAEEGREAATELGVEMADRLRERVATSQPAGAEKPDRPGRGALGRSFSPRRNAC